MNRSNLTTPVSIKPIGPMHKYTAKERTAMRESRDWLDIQEEQEVEALILHMASQAQRSMRLEAYDR